MVESKLIDLRGLVFCQGVWTIEEFNTSLEQLRQQNLQILWQSATAWQEQFISNAAYGLLAMGCMANKPKALACLAWINNIWMNHYYVQKPLVTYNYPGYDFSACGPMPYTVPELTAEILV